MKQFLITLNILLLFSCQKKMQEHKPMKQASEKSSSFYVGTYTNKDSKGIYQYSLLSNGLLKKNGLVAQSSNPSFLTKDASNSFLLAVNENDIDGIGTVESYAIKKDTLLFIDRRSSGGAHPCHISLTKEGFVLVSNYTGGNLGLLKLNEKGNLSELLDIQQHKGKGTTDRQQAPHVHSSMLNKKTKTIIASDLGTNELWLYQLDSVTKKLVKATQNKLSVKIGGGPRHFAFHPNGQWIYVLNELVSEVQLIEIDANGKFIAKGSFSILPKSYTEHNTGADIHISPDGRFLYASNRGHNSIAILKIDDTNGLLSLVDHESTKGDGPRNFSLSPDGNFLLVANQHTDNIVSFKRNSITGLLTFVDETQAPTPVCILF